MSSPSLESFKQIEAICTRFESEPHRGQSAIVKLLSEVDPGNRTALAMALLELDLELRNDKGESIVWEDYTEVIQIADVHIGEDVVRRLVEETNASTNDVQVAQPKPCSERYEFLDRIGEGAYGDVWQVNDKQTLRKLAVKVLRTKNVKDPHAATRFHREALVTGQLQHPGIPPVYDFGKLDNGLPYFAMKLVGGSTFQSILNRRSSNAQDLAACASIFEQMSQAVAYAHAQGVIHRDLKPHNVMVGDFGEVQVMDWGMAKTDDSSTDDSTQVSDDNSQADTQPEDLSARLLAPGSQSRSPPSNSSQSLTTEGDVLGTPAFMSPEQARGEKETLDARSDVFSLGAILFQILTNKRIHDGNSSFAAIQLTAQGNLDSALDDLEDCGGPAELVSLCKRCLAIAPDDRPQDAGEVSRTVTDYLVNVEQRARKAEIERHEAVLKQSENAKRRRVQLLAATAVVIASSLGTAAALSQRRQALDAQEKVTAALSLADTRREQAEAAVDELLFEVSDDEGLIARAPGAQTVRRTLLEKARDYYQALLDQSPNDPRLRLKVAKTFTRLASAETIIEPGRPKIIEYTDAALAICEAQLDQNPHDPEALRIKASALAMHGQHLLLKKSFREAITKSESATKTLREVIALQETEEHRFTLAKYLQNQAVGWAGLRQNDKAVPLLLEAVSIATPIREANLKNADYALQLGRMHNTLGSMYGWRGGDWKKCAEQYAIAIELSKAAHELLPTRPEFLDDLATQQMNAGMALTHNRKLEEAKKSFQDSAATLKQLVSDNPGIPEYQEQLSNTYSNYLTFCARHLKRKDLAAEAVRSAVIAQRKLADQFPENEFYFDDLLDRLSWDAGCQLKLSDDADDLDPLDCVSVQLDEIKRRIKERLDTHSQSEELRFRLALWIAMDPDADSKRLLELTQEMEIYDKKRTPRFTDSQALTRAMALIRASKHEEAIRLLEESRPKKPDATRVIVNSLALLPSNPDKAIELIQETKKRKHGPFNESLDDILLLWEFERLAK